MLPGFENCVFPRTITSLVTSGLIVYASCLQAADLPAQTVNVDAGSFRCIRQMTPVRHFYVDNLSGQIDATLAAANAKSGAIYPPGSVVQLVPTEAMVKREKGFNPATGDWEFFDLDVSESATRIHARGFADVNNRFAENCFACHMPAREPWDFICESGHGCDPIPIDHTITGALQRSDPRCGPAVPQAGDRWALWKLKAIVLAAWLKGLF
jgi:hypothetical protein